MTGTGDDNGFGRGCHRRECDPANAIIPTNPHSLRSELDRTDQELRLGT